MKVEPLPSEIGTKSQHNEVAVQHNNWLQNEVVQATSLRPGTSLKAPHFTPGIIDTQPKAILPNVEPTRCPPGLEYLASIDQLLVQQKVELVETITGYESDNKFNVKNTLGQKVFWAAENNDCCTRNCCGSLRRFKMQVFDAYQNEVMNLRRPAACNSCLFPCCLQSIEVSAPPGHVIGSVVQKWSCNPYFLIKDVDGNTVLRMEGPCCTFSICGNDVEFKILTLGGMEIGKISKQWSGLARELFTDADFFGISFPLELDVEIKAILLGACFLIDAMYFESSGRRRHWPGICWIPFLRFLKQSKQERHLWTAIEIDNCHMINRRRKIAHNQMLRSSSSCC